MEPNEIMTYVSTGIGAILTYVFVSNPAMREGITDILLKKMNKTKIKKIPLINHRLFALLTQSQFHLVNFIITDPVKLYFYTTYIDITFKHTHALALNILLLKKEVETKNSKVDFNGKILELMYKTQADINKDVAELMCIPKKVEGTFNQWRAMLRGSFNQSLSAIINDDLFDNYYFITYRVLDMLSYYIETILQSSTVEMQRLNGAFKDIKITDLKQDKDE